MAKFFWSLALFIFLFIGCTSAPKENLKVESQCSTYFYASKNLKPDFTLVVESWGTGLYTRGGKQFSSTLAAGYESGSLAILAIDNPGIIYDSKTGKFTVDTDKYITFIQDDLVVCTVEALKKSFKLYSPANIILKGHSEGSSIAVRSYLTLLKSEPSISAKVSALFLSGISMGSFQSELESQFKALFPKTWKQEISKVQTAIDQKDEKYLLENGGLSSKYLNHALMSSPMRKAYEQLAKLDPQAEVYFFHGKNDFNTPVSAVKAFEKWNSTQPQNLKLKTFYYDSFHGLNSKANADISRVVAQNVFEHLKTFCGDLDSAKNGKYCLTPGRGELSSTLIYYFHGGQGDEKDWNNPDSYTEIVRKIWNQNTKGYPSVVAISFGDYWLLTSKKSTSESGLLEAMIGKAIPQIENRILPIPPQKRIVVGESMGGGNAAILAFHRPELFPKAALLCPALELGSEKANRYKRFFPALEKEEDFSPIALLERIPPQLRKKMDLFLSCGDKDEFGFFKPAEEFVQAARTLGVSVEWAPVKGRHCSLDVEKLNEFLIR